MDAQAPAGHYRTTAGALAFMGALGLSVAGASAASAAELRFIEPSAMALFSALYLAVAAVMVAAPPR
jgi:hypothetical protein